MDRASGSGVFARDPDALLDMIQLPLDENQQKTIADKAECKARVEYLQKHHVELPGPDDQLSAVQMKAWCDSHLVRPGGWAVPGAGSIAECSALAERARREAMSRTAWRIEGTLREFPAFAPVNLWFQYPIHRIDGEGGILQDIDPEEVKPLWQKASEARKKKNEKKGNKVATERFNQYTFMTAAGEDVKLTDLAEKWGMSEQGARKWINGKTGSQHFYIKDGNVYLKSEEDRNTKRNETDHGQ